MIQFRTLTSALMAACLAVPALAQITDLPQREGPRPETTNNVPHVQLALQSAPALKDEMLKRVAQFPGVSLGPTRVSLPGATGFQLAQSLKLAHPNVIVGAREFAHMHPDGSLHISLEPNTAIAAIEKGWAVSHPWSAQRDGWEGFVMLYSPTTQEELAIVMDLIESSYIYVTGQKLP